MSTCLGRSAVRIFRERLSICVYASFPFRFERGFCDLIVLVPDSCLVLLFFFYFSLELNSQSFGLVRK